MMKAINIPAKTFGRLERTQIPNEIHNTEAKMYNYTYLGEKKIIKSFYVTSGESFASKMYTVEMLHDSKAYLPSTICIPDYLLSINHKTVGFTVPFVEGINLTTALKDTSLTPEEHIYYLKQVGLILEQLKNIRKYTPLNDFYLNDIHEDNFIVNPNNKSVTAIDVDSCKIGNNISYPSRYLNASPLISEFIGTKYEQNLPDKHGKLHGYGFLTANENSDIYCYIIMIINYLMGSDCHNMTYVGFYNYLNYLNSIGIDKGLLDTIASIGESKYNENPVNYLDTLTETQIYRSRERIYELNKKRVLHL